MLDSRKALSRIAAGAALVAALATLGCSAATVPATTDSGSAATVAATTAQAQIEVEVTIDSTAAEGGSQQACSVEVPEGASALDALLATGVDVSVEDSDYGKYVSAVGGVEEQTGDTSAGWTYTVDGEMPNDSADAHAIEAGDEIVWTYVEF